MIEAFYLDVGLWMVRRRARLRDAENPESVLVALARKLRTVIALELLQRDVLEQSV